MIVQWSDEDQFFLVTIPEFGDHVFMPCKQALQLPISDRWQLVQTLLESLKRETHPMPQRGNMSRLRGIAKS
jgi:hypothetical protein